MNRLLSIGLAVPLFSSLVLLAACGDTSPAPSYDYASARDMSVTSQPDMVTTGGGDMVASGDDMTLRPDAGSGPDMTATGATHTVMVGPNGALMFSPSDITIAVGDTVHWVWASSGHTVNSGTALAPDDKFCSPSDTMCTGANPTSVAGATYDHVFTSVGVFPYHCRPHGGAGMVGSVTVQ